MHSLKSILLSVVMVFLAALLTAQTADSIWVNEVPFDIEYIHANANGETVVAGPAPHLALWPDRDGYAIYKYDPDGNLAWSRLVVSEDSYSVDVNEVHINDLGEIIFLNDCDPNSTSRLFISYDNSIVLVKGIVKLSQDGYLDFNIPYPGTSTHPRILLPCGLNQLLIWQQSSLCYINLYSTSGTLISSKNFHSNYDFVLNFTKSDHNCLFLAGEFNSVYVNSAIIYFEDEIDGTIVINPLYGYNGPYFIACLDIDSNLWKWQRNHENWIGPGLIDNEEIIIYYSEGATERYLEKIDAQTGSHLLTLSIPSNLHINELFNSIGDRHLFYGCDLTTDVYGEINDDLTLTEYYITPRKQDSFRDNDQFGFMYFDSGPWPHSNPAYFSKRGFTDPYPIRPDPTPINFTDCYPNVMYEAEISIVNIGNSPLSISGFQFSNDHPGLTAEVVSGSPAAPRDSILVRVAFNDENVGAVSDTLIVFSNSPLIPELRIGITGNVLEVPPQEPSSLDITLDGSDVILTWPAVTESIFDTPLTPDYYFVYQSSDPFGTYYLLGVTPGLTYTHALVGIGAQRMFYKVSAYLYTGRGSCYLDNVGIEPGMSEVEIRNALH